MRQLTDAMARVAPIPSPILIVGESGTGKELVARELHRLSGREKEPFVAVNAAALPDTLVESELFGHERGAFTGAVAMRLGAFEGAGRGTIFLDEIGDLPLPAQAKLLRVLEARTIVRVGGLRPIVVSARVLAATNRNLDAAVSAGHFREDLLFRLNAHLLRVPPLRDRLSDLPELVDRLLFEICERFAVPRKRASSALVELLSAQEWRRNNVRELRNALERMVVQADSDELEVTHAPADVTGGPNERRARSPKTFAERRAEAERRIILEALERNAWHITRTAADLGLADHASLLKIMRRRGVGRPDPRSPVGVRRSVIGGEAG